jgi:chromosome partitioning protein
MIITVTSHKGGVGKTTTAIHLAAYLQRLAPTLLVDGDAIRSATKWSQRGGNTGLPFKVVTHAQLVNHVHDTKTVTLSSIRKATQLTTIPRPRHQLRPARDSGRP